MCTAPCRRSGARQEGGGHAQSRTSEATVEHVIDLVDLILVMSVNPGFGGQSFIPAAIEKVARLRAMAGGRPIDIEVDGGVTPETAPKIVRAGANVLVAGSAVFRGGPAAYRATLRRSAMPPRWRGARRRRAGSTGRFVTRGRIDYMDARNWPGTTTQSLRPGLTSLNNIPRAA